ncbi:MAG TPA: hypothetical protein VIM90_04560, partial [Arenimonas sp.]
EALAQAQEEAKAANYEARVQRELGRQARNTMRYVGDALRRFDLTACLPAEAQSVVGDPRTLDGYRVSPGHAAMQRLEYWKPSDDPIPNSWDRIVDLNVLSSAITRDAKQGCTYVHVFLTGRGEFNGRWVYAASDSVFAQGLPPDARQQVAEHLIRELLARVDRDLTTKGRRAAR